MELVLLHVLLILHYLQCMIGSYLVVAGGGWRQRSRSGGGGGAGGFTLYAYQRDSFPLRIPLFQLQ